MMPTDRWRRLLDERLAEAITVLGTVPGVHGLIVGGSLGRGEPWPMSDIDLLPVHVASADPARSWRRAALNWWTGGPVGCAKSDVASELPVRSTIAR